MRADAPGVEARTIIAAEYPPGSRAYDLLTRHGELVAAKALEVAARVAHLRPDTEFIFQAALLHDIGIRLTSAPELGCNGPHPYICHGYLGREMLERRGLPRHALVCERHVGVGLTTGDIRRQGLPLPLRDMRPATIEEEIICYADKFFSKNGATGGKAKSAAQVLDELRPYGPRPTARFKRWMSRFEGER